ncbi:MAG: hypothetical protein NC230_09005 [Bacteroides sp.]|nr:hypothetical protein [Bacteroides sp.]
MDYDYLGEYNGGIEHDMWVYFTYHENTDELSDEFGGDDFDEFIDSSMIGSGL